MRVRSIADLAAAVRGRRQDRRLSQSELARHVGVSRKWIGEFERGKPTAEFGLVIRVLEELGLTLEVGDDADAAPALPASARGTADLGTVLEEHRRR
jgi:y4mF family transcriptional regulator